MRFALLLAAGTGGCEQAEQVRDRFRDATPHERYARGLFEAGLTETALGRAWIGEATISLDAVVPIPLPFHEVNLLSPETPEAVAYRLEIPRGQSLGVEIAVETDDSTRVFVDLFRVPDDGSAALRPVFSMDSVPGRFTYEPWRGGDFVLRVQPELLRGGRVHVSLSLDAQLAFPVSGRDTRAIQSVFGDPREGGRRRHHGVDIFAPRGTPVIASAPGRVTRVEVTDLGGKVVWLRDPARNASLYYAHLDSQDVVPGQVVARGDTLGFVGNTGNARTTPPHLHFGLYRRGEGPVDPVPFVRRTFAGVQEIPRELDALGRVVTVSRDGINLRAGPSLKSDVVQEMTPAVPLRVLAGSGTWYRVRTPDGLRGYVAARLLDEDGIAAERGVVADGGG
ncbi:MAG: M23 family metallopeptidase [Gemmatimonadota bacterium]|nr:M23 family metallopeptidase [Gemmatimonadota bacterium]MDH5759125.1 M23 family metallopeptidase [Gemmatimonadota bacterium]